MTSAFYQLAPSVVQRIRNNYRTTPRPNLPTRLTFLTNCGVDNTKLDSLRSVFVESEDERLAVAWILLRIFRGQTFHASLALSTWLRRKGAGRPDVKEAAIHFAESLLEDDIASSDGVKHLPLIQASDSESGTQPFSNESSCPKNTNKLQPVNNAESFWIYG